MSTVRRLRSQLESGRNVVVRHDLLTDLITLVVVVLLRSRSLFSRDDSVKDVALSSRTYRSISQTDVYRLYRQLLPVDDTLRPRVPGRQEEANPRVPVSGRRRKDIECYDVNVQVRGRRG